MTDHALTTEVCTACGMIQVEGGPVERLRRLTLHWPNCRGVSAVTFHPDGEVAGVVFKR